MSDKLRSMQAELAKLRKTDNNNTQKRKTNSTNLFHDKNKKVAKVASRTASPLSRARSRSRSPVREKPRSRSGSRSRSPASRKSRSLSPSGDNREKGGTDSRVGDVSSVDGGENSTVDDVLGVGHHGGSLGPLDDRLAGNRGGHVHVVGGVHVDGGGHLHDVLLALGHVAGHLSATLNQAGVLHPVHLDLPLDDGGVVGDGSLEHGGDRDGDMGSGGLEDLGGVT